MSSFFPVIPPEPSKPNRANKYGKQARKHPWKSPKKRVGKRKVRAEYPSDRTISRDRAKYLASIFDRSRDEA